MVRSAAIMVVAGGLATAACQASPRHGPAGHGASGRPPAANASPKAAGEVPAADVPPSPELLPFYQQHPVWKSCGKGLQCATVRVPLDYRNPGGERIKIALNRLPSTGSGARIGSLLLNPGGPGASGLEALEGAATQFDPAIRARFDLVGFDPRGVGKSAPILCRSSTSPKTGRGLEKDLAAYWRWWSRACERGSGRLLPYVGTENAARDMDVLRAALGDRTLTYVGWSYGTELGSIYADLFPKRVRALVLDGAVDLAETPARTPISEAKGAELTLRSFIAACLAAPGCPLRSRTVDGGVQELLALRKRADSRPLANSLEPDSPVYGADVQAGVHAGLYGGPKEWPALSAALDRALNHADGGALASLNNTLSGRKADGTWSNQMAASTAIDCVDTPRIYRPAAEAAAREAANEAPMFGSDPGITYSWLRCSSWPAPSPAAQRRPPRAAGSAPILVVGTRRDPATPYASAQALARELENATLLTYDGDGHAAYLRAGSFCIDDVVNRYLLRVEPPAAGQTCS